MPREWKPDYIVNDFVPPSDRQACLDELKARVPAFARKVQPIYELLKWTWIKGVPTVDRIEGQLYNAIETLRKDAGVRSLESGGLRVELEYEFEQDSDVPSTVHGFMRFKVDESVWSIPTFQVSELERDDFFFTNTEGAE